jgi:arylformamidase
MSSLLDDAYNTRLWAPGYDETLAANVRRGEEARKYPSLRRDLAWGHGDHRKVDVFEPRGRSGALIIFIHGGYWQYRGSGCDGGSFLALPFLERGMAFAAMTYELCPTISLSRMIDEVRQGVSWIVSAMAGFGFNVERTVLIGHSAGAHLAAMTALAPPGAAPPIAGVCGVSGLYDLRPLVGTYLNDALRLDEASALSASPISLLRSGMPEFVIAIGARESPAFHAQSAMFSAAVQAFGGKSSLLTLDAHDHYSAITALNDAAAPIASAVTAMATAKQS